MSEERTGRIWAVPNPICLGEGIERAVPLGATHLQWSAERARTVEVHVHSPSGPLVSRTGPKGSCDTGEWVRDGTVFYLQDVSDGKLLAPENTLDFVTVALCVRDVGGVASRAVPLVGAVRFGDFRRPTPISYEWGFDRGQPIDRYYIENFLSAQAGDIQGHVLEFGNDSYTRRFGCDKVMTRDVLNYPYRTEETTFLTDLVSAPEIPSEIFDCVICTQTLQLVWDTRAAIRTLHRVLKPGGVLLATFPGLSQTYDTNWGERWYWNFTSVSARELFGEVFGGEHTVVDVHGNVLAAISFLHGLSAAELTVSELEARVPGYEVTISVRAVKAKGSEGE